MRIGAGRGLLAMVGALGAIIALSSCDGEVVAPDRGTLQVTIGGLPTGQAAAVTVTGPGGFSRALTATANLADLEPGDYTVAAQNVERTEGRWSPTPTTQAVTVNAGSATGTATVTYALVTARLVVNITGLPNGVGAAVTVTGPGGFTNVITTSATFNFLAPGAYTITAADVASGGTTYRPAPTTQTLQLPTSTTQVTATVVYSDIAAPLALAVAPIAEGLSSPVYLTAPPNDPRLFIVEQPGRIRIYKNGALLATPFLDITSIVEFAGEQGLLSVAFDPAYATNGRFYVYYNNIDGDIAVARYTANPASDVADANSRQSVVTIPHPGQSNHNGGLAMFGPDGFLYLGTGDGGGSGDPNNNAQNTNSLLGKLLRIDVTNLPYTSPPTNPFAGATAGRDEIWAYGLRNPWRYAFDAPGGTLYIADVGQDDWEEVNAVATTVAGVNYGWRIMEGAHCFNAATCNTTNLTLPVLEYNHNEGCSITGGFVYRGAAIPEMTGHYFYSDFCAGFLRSFRLSAGQAVDMRTWTIGDIGNILSFGRDAAGELYMLSDNGRVYRVVKQ